MLKRIFALALGLVMAASLMVPAMAAEPDTKVPEELQVSQLYMVLPDWIATPDGMTIDKDGNLILAVPNFGDLSLPGCIARITPDGKISKWFDVQPDAESGVARPMGLEFGPDGSLWIVDNQGWTGEDETANHGRILKVSFDAKGNVASTTEVATGMEHPNGIKIKGNYAYVTQSSMTPVEDPSGKLVSAVYRFPLDAKGIKVTNTLDDENILLTFITENPNCQYGLDGLVFDHDGNLYVGNFGDGAISKITFDEKDNVVSNEIWAQDSDNLVTTDGMSIDDNGNIYVADFNRNAIAMVTPDGKITRIAQSPDSTGAKGELDQPGEAIVWNGMLIVSCFDMVTDDGKINSAHDAPQTLAWIPLSNTNMILDVPEELQVSQLFMKLPDWIATPDSMTIDPANGDLILSCPNFGDLSLPGCVARITADGKISKWFDVPVDAETKSARPMGLEFGPDGSLFLVDNQPWNGAANHGRILKLTFDANGKIASTTEVATGMEHPNGVKIKGNYAYVTQSNMVNVKDPSGKLVSAVYRFPLDAEGVKVTNTLDDENILLTFITENPDCQYGLDGLVFDKDGNLYVGNFGDGAISKITFDENDNVVSNEIWAQDRNNLMTTDGMCMDENGNIYVADFNPNAIAKVTPDGKITRIAQSPDSNGALGQLDQPGEPIVWNGKLIAACFDMVTDPGKVNSAHDAPQTLVWIALDGEKPAASETSFADVGADRWFAPAVAYVSGAGLMKGNANGSFNPDGKITGAEFAQILFNKDGEPKAAEGAAFQGVESQWYAPAILWAAGAEIITDSGDAAVVPTENLTRQQIALMLYNYLGAPEGTADLSDFSDAGQISSWAQAAMEWAVSAKVLQGSAGKLNPTGTASRAEVAQILMNYFG